MINQAVAEEFVLVDVNEAKAEGEAMDLSHAVPFAPGSTRVWKVAMKIVKMLIFVVITAGLPQKPGETRLDLVEKNAKSLNKLFVVLWIAASMVSS